MHYKHFFCKHRMHYRRIDSHQRGSYRSQGELGNCKQRNALPCGLLHCSFIFIPIGLAYCLVPMISVHERLLRVGIQKIRIRAIGNPVCATLRTFHVEVRIAPLLPHPSRHRSLISMSLAWSLLSSPSPIIASATFTSRLVF